MLLYSCKCQSSHGSLLDTFYCQLTSDSCILPSQPDHHEILDTAEFVSEKCTTEWSVVIFALWLRVWSIIVFSSVLYLSSVQTITARLFFCKLQMKEWCNKLHILSETFFFLTARFQLPTRLYCIYSKHSREILKPYTCRRL